MPLSPSGPAPRRGERRRSADAPAPPLGQLGFGFGASTKAIPTSSKGASACLAAWRLLRDIRSQLQSAGESVMVRDDAGQTRTGRAIVREVDVIAARLAAAGIGPGDVVAAWLPRDADLLAAMLGTLQRGACWLPLDVRWPQARAEATLQRAGAQICLHRGAAPSTLTRLLDLSVDADLRATSGEAASGGGDRAGDADAFAALRGLSDDSAAFAISTSGTTGAPKIATNTWRGLANVVRAWIDTPGLGPGRVQAALSSPAFDMSMLQWLCPPLAGAQIAALGDNALFDPAATARTLRTLGVTDLLLPPSTWRLLRQAGYLPTPETTVTFGGEALDESTLADATARCGAVWNGWGVSEAAACTTLARVDRGELPPVVGWPLPGCRVWAVDLRGAPVPAGATGELAIGGVGVGTGDLRDGEDARWCVLSGDAAGQRAYRCGDQGRVEADGSVSFLGRGDGQLKVRGLRVQAEELEATLRLHSAVRDCAVDVRQTADGPVLCAWVVGPGADALPALRTLLASRLPAGLIPTVWRWPLRLPLSASGKVDRRALVLGDGELDRGSAVDREAAGGSGSSVEVPVAAAATPPDDQETAEIAASMASVLGLRQLGPDADFFALGGDSLAVARLRARLAETMGLEVPTLALWTAPSPRALAATLRLTATSRGTASSDKHTEHAERTEGAERAYADPAAGLVTAPMLASQRGVWLQARQRGHDPALCVVAEIELDGPLDADALERAWESVAAQQQGLRVSFGLIDDIPQMRLHERAAMPWRRLSVETLTPERQDSMIRALTERALAAPFDLEAAPPWRSLLVRRGEQAATWLLIAHHVALDGGSLEPLLDAVAATLSSEAPNSAHSGPQRSLPSLGVREARAKTSAAVAAQRRSWQTALASLRRPAPLPALLQAASEAANRAKNATAAPSPSASRCERTLDAATWRSALRVGATVHATPLMVLTGAVSRWLAARSDNAPAVLATVLPGREVAGSADIIGQLATTIPLLPAHLRNGGFRDACVAGRDALLAAMARADVGIDTLATMAPAGAAALLRCCVLLQPPAPAPRAAGALRLTLQPQPAIGAPFDLGVEAFVQDDGSLRLVFSSRIIGADDALAASADDLCAAIARGTRAPDAANLGEPRDEPALREAAIDCWAASWPRIPRPLPSAGDRDDHGRPDKAATAAAAPTGESATVTSATSAPTDEPATLVGRPLQPAMAALGLGPSSRLRDLLDRAAANRAPIDVIDREGATTGRDAAVLRDEALALAARIPGDKAICVRADDPWLLLVGLWACWLAERLAVPLAIDLDADAVASALRLAGADALLLLEADAATLARAATTADVALVMLDATDRRASDRDVVAAAADEEPAGAAGAPSEAACLGLLTSGSSGTPKLVLHGAGSLLAQVAGWGSHQGFGSADVFANWLPLDHVAALCMFHLQPLAQSAAQLHARPAWVLAQPTRWLDMVADNAASITWAPNFGLELLLGCLAAGDAQRDIRRWKLHSLRAVLLGGESIVPATARRFAEAIASAGAASDCLVPGWGMSETASATFTRPGTTAAEARAAESFGYLPLGRPVPGFAVQIVDEAGEVCPRGVPGRLWVRGPMLRQSVRGGPAPETDADGWLDTGDRASISAAGDVYVLGRDDETVRVHGLARDALTLENAALATGRVEGGTACAFVARRGGRGDPGVALVWSQKGRNQTTADEATSADTDAGPATFERAEAAAQIADAVAAATGLRPQWLVCIDPAELPRTGIGKIRRAALRERFEAGELDDGLAPLTQAWGLWRARWRPHVPAAADRRTPPAVVLIDGAVWLRDGLTARGIRCLDADEQRAQPGPTAPLVVAGAGLSDASESSTCADSDSADAAFAAIEALLRRLGDASTSPGAANPSDRRMLLVHTAATPLARLRAADAARGALLQVAALEQGGAALQLELDADSDSADGQSAILDAIENALRRDWRGEAMERWRDGCCTVRRLQPAGDASQLARGAIAPKPAGSDEEGVLRIVLLGGSGGVGTLLQDALDRLGAAVLVLSRSATERSKGLATAQRAYADVDLADAVCVEAAIAAWEREVGPASHIVWAATVGRPATLAEERRPDLATSRAALWRARIHGADTLRAILAKRNNARLLDISSVHAALPGHALGAYAAAASHAGATLEAIASSHHAPVGSLLCAGIRGVGLSRSGAGQDQARALGFAAMEPEHVVQVVLQALWQPAGELWVGLDARGAAIRRLVDDLADAGPDALRTQSGTSAPGPSQPTNAADARPQAPGSSSADPAAEAAAAATIAALWASLLDRAELPHERSFFELGGNSLLMARLQDGLERAFARTIPMAELFDRPTIRDQARWLGTQGTR